MRLAVVVRARSYLRTLGPIISEALRRKYEEVLVYVPPMALKSSEERVRYDELQRYWPGVLMTSDAKAFQIVAEVVIGLNGGMDGVVPPEGIPTILVDPTFDAWLAPPTHARQVYSSFYHWDVHHRAFGQGPEPRHDIMAGWVNGDWRGHAGAELWNSGHAVFFSLKLNVPGRGRWFWDGMPAYRHAAEHARDVARHHGLTFVVKGRDKHNDPRWLKNLGEYYTDADHPYMSMRLLVDAHWCIHYAPSGVGREAALLGVPQTVLRVPTPHLNSLPGHAERMNMLDAGRWPGVISDRLMPFTIDEKQRQAWVAQYLGVQDGRCAERVMDAI